MSLWHFRVSYWIILLIKGRGLGDCFTGPGETGTILAYLLRQPEPLIFQSIRDNHLHWERHSACKTAIFRQPPWLSAHSRRALGHWSSQLTGIRAEQTVKLWSRRHTYLTDTMNLCLLTWCQTGCRPKSKGCMFFVAKLLEQECAMVLKKSKQMADVLISHVSICLYSHGEMLNSCTYYTIRWQESSEETT